MPIPRDAHYEPGTNRHSVRLASGQIVTRATAENIYAQSLGYSNNYERKIAWRDMKQSKGARGQYATDMAKARARGVSAHDFKEARAQLRAEYKRNGNSWVGIDNSTTGALARYRNIIHPGYESYPVGDSPGVK
jgi:hypothetical protein